MIRAFACRQGMGGIALIVICLLVTPVQAADDYSFLFPPGNLSPGCEYVSVPMEDDGSDHQKCCSCAICMEALGESFAPMIAPPGSWSLLVGPPLNVLSSLYHPEILRPPIA